MASYSRRIERPRGWYLEPFITWVDAFNVRSGNPALKPEYIDAMEIGYLKGLGDHSISFEGYYRISNNKTERIRSVYADNVMLSRPENVGTDYALGGELVFSFKLLQMVENGSFREFL
jgi:outer membrane receptor protein involved in Fe transport